MGSRIETEFETWKKYNTATKEYIIGRSCVYDSTLPRLTVRLFVHRLRNGEEIKIGEISLSVERDDWKQKGSLDTAVEADNQLREACLSAKQGNWRKEPLARILSQGFEEIKKQIEKYEKNGIEINAELTLQ